MHTPDEIKKGLGCCFADNQHDCKNCAYAEMVKDEEFGETFFFHCGEIDKDALAYIQQLEMALEDEKNKNEILIFDNDKLMEEFAQVERERDALMHDLANSAPCFACYHFIRNNGACKGGMRCCDEQFKASIDNSVYDGPEWKWRGVCPKNTKED